MDLLANILVFGFTALALFILSVIFIWKKKYTPGLIFAISELLSAAVSAFSWMYALKISGKADWYLFGLFRYTPIALICVCMFTVGVLCVFWNIWGLVERRKALHGHKIY